MAPYMTQRCSACPAAGKASRGCGRPESKALNKGCKFAVSYLDKRGNFHKVDEWYRHGAFTEWVRFAKTGAWRHKATSAWYDDFDTAQAALNRRAQREGWTVA